MKQIHILIRLLMFLGSVAFSGLLLVGGWFTYVWPSTPEIEKLVGVVSIVCAIICFMISFQLFMRSIRLPILILCVISVGITTLYVISGTIPIDSEVFVLVLPYIIGLVLLYLVDGLLVDKVDRKQLQVSGSKAKRFDLILLLVPVLIITSAILYFAVISPWLDEAKSARYRRVVVNGFNFKVYKPEYVPSQFRFEHERLSSDEKYIYAKYNAGNGRWFTIAQYQMPNNISLQEPYCVVGGGRGDDYELFYSSSFATALSGECRMFTTAGGLEVFVFQNPLIKLPRNYAVVLIGNTLVGVDGYDFSEQELGKMLDLME